MKMAPPPNDFEDEAPMAEAPLGETHLEEAAMAYEIGSWRLLRLRELRAEIQDLLAILESIRSGDVTLKSYASYVHKTKDDVRALLADIDDGDTIRHIRNIWEQMLVCPMMADPEGEYKPQDQLNYLNMLTDQSRKIIYSVGLLTIPARVNDWLANARPGYYIPFHSVFDDELPIPEDRVRVLNYLAWSPKVVKGGLVDIASGLIYRHSRSVWSILGSFLLLILALGLAIGIVIGSSLLPVENWPIQGNDLSALLIGWGAVLIGVIVHSAVGAVKRSQAQGGRPPIISIGDLPLQVNAKIGQIMLKILLTLIGLFGLVLTTGIDDTTTLNAFLVGYSLDSVVEVFGASIEQQATAQVTALKRQLGVNAE